MKILIIMDPGIMIPVKGYGGHERLVETFAKEYHRMGHEVHLLITGGSHVEGCTVHDFGKEGFPPKKMEARRAIPIAWKFLWKHRDDFDLYHNFGRLVYLLPVLRHPVKKIMTYGREISNRNIRIFHKLHGRNIVYTACSGNLLSRVNASGPWAVVHNAIDFSKYEPVKEVGIEAPLFFLGRLERVKGCHTAIRVAKESGNKLIIAGNISELPEEKAYFDNEIRPEIDGKQIMYIGPIDDFLKNEYLGKAKALLFPIDWNEPFGIVMIEAMACGTPVIAFKKGSVDEVVDEGITGFKVTGIDEMVNAIGKIGSLNRCLCRKQAMQRFNAPVIAAEYLRIILNPPKKVVIITTGQPAANPRVLKEYEALQSNGYDVRVLYSYSAGWSHKIDEEKFEKGVLKRIHFKQVGGDPYKSKAKYFFSRVYHKFLRTIQPYVGIEFINKMALVRPAFHLWMNAQKFKADLYIAHYLGALPAAIKAGARYHASVVFDAEDFHRGEEPYYENQIKQVIAMEDRLLPMVDYITTASPLITQKYKQLYPSKKVTTINNVFSKKYIQPVRQSGKELTLFWFSQNIGPNRGLETVMEAINKLPFKVSLNLLGNIRDHKYVDHLMKTSVHPERISVLEAVSPENIFSVAARYDIGIAAEIPYCENRDICLTNKIFTYLMAGNCILASDTRAQKIFMENNETIGLLYRHNDSGDLARKIGILNDNRNYLQDCRQNAKRLAECCLNWENESKKLLSVMNEIFPKENKVPKNELY